MPLAVGFPPRRPAPPAAWSEALPGLEPITGEGPELLRERLRAGELDAVVTRWRAVVVGLDPEAAAPGVGAEVGQGLMVGAVPPRPEPRDLLVPSEGTPTLATLAGGGRVALAGRRRRAFLAAHRPDLEPVDLPADPERTLAPFLRGGGADAAILSASRTRRAGLSDAASQVLDPKEWLPAPGQGASLVLVRAGDEAAVTALAPLHHPSTRAALEAEHALTRALGAGPDAGLGALALPYGRWLRLWAMAAQAEGRRVIRGDLSGSDRTPGEVAHRVARLLRDRGADLLDDLTPSTGATHATLMARGGGPS